MVKTPTNWSANMAAEANVKVYSSAVTTYSSPTVTYSTIVVGNQADTTKLPTIWTGA